jgi:succinoglycan biosynthesis transport protein ExoP
MDLTRFVHVVRTSWLLVVAAVAGGVLLGALVVATQAPSYTARTQLFVSTPSTPANLSDTYQGGLFSQQRVLSYSQIVSSPTVVRNVIASLKLPYTVEQLRRKIQATVPVNTVVINVAVADRSATRAAAIANAIGVQFPLLVQSLETAPGRQPPVKVTVTRPADVPPSASSPRTKLILAIAAVLGLALGIGLAALRWFFDTRVQTAADASSLAATPVLGSIPNYGRRVRKRPLVAADISSSSGEPLRRLRTNLRVRLGRGRKAFVITSALPGDGKTLVAANLGIVFAQAGYSVALVDGNLRNPKLTAVLGLSPAVGLTNVLVKGMPVTAALQHWGKDVSLSVLASGPLPGNPTELLDSSGFASMLAQLEREHDVVIVDSPALLPFADAAIVARVTTQALLVTNLNSTRADQLDSAVEYLRAVDTQILGIVLNRSRKGTPASHGGRVQTPIGTTASSTPLSRRA